MQSYLILGRQRSPFLFICIAGWFFLLCRMQTTSSLRSENVCVLQRGMSIFYSKKLHFYLESIHIDFCNLDFLALKPSNGLIKFLNNSWLIIWEFVLKEKTYNYRKLSTNETLIFIFDNGLKLIKQISATTTDYVD